MEFLSDTIRDLDVPVSTRTVLSEFEDCMRELVYEGRIDDRTAESWLGSTVAIVTDDVRYCTPEGRYALAERLAASPEHLPGM